MVVTLPYAVPTLALIIYRRAYRPHRGNITYTYYIDIKQWDCKLRLAKTYVEISQRPPPAI